MTESFKLVRPRQSLSVREQSTSLHDAVSDSNNTKASAVANTNKPRIGQQQSRDASKTKSVSIFSIWLARDVRLSLRLSVCASAESWLGSWRPLMKFLEYSCHGVPWLAGTILALLMAHRADLQEKLLNLLTALLLDCLVVGVLKYAVRRKRPAHNKDDMFLAPSVDRYSFPSGHTTRAAMVSYFFIMNFSTGAVFNALVVLWGAAVACSRVMLGRHHVSDVLCGLVVGVLTYRLVNYFWLPNELCIKILTPMFEHFHL